MRIALLIVAAALASGCGSSHTRIDTGPTAGTVPVTGTSVSGARVGVEYPSSSAAPGIVLLTALGLWLYSEASLDSPEGEAFTSGRQAPALDPDRRIHEQDCSRPIEVPTANLRCR